MRGIRTEVMDSKLDSDHELLLNSEEKCPRNYGNRKSLVWFVNTQTGVRAKFWLPAILFARYWRRLVLCTFVFLLFNYVLFVVQRDDKHPVRLFLLNSSRLFSSNRLDSRMSNGSTDAKLYDGVGTTAVGVLQTGEIEYLIDTKTCRLKEWPLFDEETTPLYVNMTDKYYECDKMPEIRVKRVNLTWVKIELPVKNNISESSWLCYAREVQRYPNGDSYDYGPYFGPVGFLTNFANNLTDADVNDKGVQFWNSVEIMCNKSEPEKDKFTHVVPLVQYYHSKVNATKPKINVMMFGIDSISRMNFMRHFVRTKKIVDQQGFIPLYGYHKVGENSFPNIIQMFTGHQLSDYYNVTIRNEVEFDNISLIFKEFEKRGYVTTFNEDMPSFGFFTYGKGGFKKQPTTYYLRPSNIVIRKEMYYSCYKGILEYKVNIG